MRGFIGSGKNNEITTGATYSTIVGGQFNTVSSGYGFIGGGDSNTVTSDYSFIGGGKDNTASNYYSTVAGGQNNTASADYSFVGGGRDNTASGRYGTVSGGYRNTVSNYATIGGGYSNTASADYSTVAGGFFMEANSWGETVFGLYGTQISGNTNSWIGTDRIFGIGNGKSGISRSDALVILKNGVIDAPSTELSGITGTTHLITKEYLDKGYDKEGYTVSGLSALSPIAGARTFVTDATATTFYSIVAGGGGNIVPVFYNGTNWVIA